MKVAITLKTTSNKDADSIQMESIVLNFTTGKHQTGLGWYEIGHEHDPQEKQVAGDCVTFSGEFSDIIMDSDLEQVDIYVEHVDTLDPVEGVEPISLVIGENQYEFHDGKPVKI